ncbi:unnamed protein product [Didymodactylos carnosus]|uniref:Reverse transcriptase domain-containing protein n=1 Tax=Didymodactylos carnosus TaxID=1234261 RepID=A0A815ZDS7_9BILA|nr:unnamed protein product [Didymodactylos carnosus]CAF4452176.1 unnamed protein product [Didymodactylos carnosus]
MGDKQTFTKLNAFFQRQARKDKERYLKEECQKIEEDNQKGRTRDLFKKIREVKGKFTSKTGILKDQEGRSLSEGEEIKKRCKEYTETLYRKDLNTIEIVEEKELEQEPDILESEVQWALKRIANNKATGIDGIPVELLKNMGDTAVKTQTALCQQVWRTLQWPTDWKRSVYIPIPKKGDTRECSNYRTIALISHASKVMLKIIQARLQPYMERELPDVQAGFRKGRGTRDQIANIRWIMEKAREYQKEFYFCFIDYTKAFDCVDHDKLWEILKEMGIPKHLIHLMKSLYENQEATVRTEHGDTE